MKKQLITIFLFAIIFMALLATSVNAAGASVSLTSNKESVKPGESFTVKYSIACEEGINGGRVKIEYDTEKLELVSNSVNSKFTNMGEDLTFEVMHNSQDTIKNVDLLTLNFKAKANLADGTTKITASDIMVDSDAAENSEETLASKELTITIANEVIPPALTEIKVTKQPTKTTYTEGEKFDKTGMEITAVYADGTSKVITGYTISPDRALKTTDKKVTVSYTENGVTKQIDIDITVNAKAGEEPTGGATLSEIKITKKPEKTTYTEGEKFDTKGMVVTAYYSDGTSKVVTNYKISPDGALKTTDKKITVSYTEGTITKKADLEITVKAKANPSEPDKTTAEPGFPNAGVEKMILPVGIIMIISGISLIVYAKTKRV